MNVSAFTPDPTEYNRHINSFSAVRNKKNPLANLWFFDSPKCDKRLTITTDPLFMHVVLLEGDRSVTGYAVNDQTTDSDGLRPSLRVYFLDRHVEWWLVKWSANARGANAAALAKECAALSETAKASGATFHIKTEKDIRGKEVLFDNWLNLCAGMTRCRSMSTAHEAVALKEAFMSVTSLRYADLVAPAGIDQAHMFALVGHALQTGTLDTDLQNQLFGPNAILTRGHA
jgi:hypothetical protein